MTKLGHIIQIKWSEPFERSKTNVNKHLKVRHPTLYLVILFKSNALLLKRRVEPLTLRIVVYYTSLVRCPLKHTVSM